MNSEQMRIWNDAVVVCLKAWR